ncbi:hypothetical protein H4R19_002409 [Coemansia spiralis]|nr:hypothetical protein H4R19_002409 [Coemansia spiralis]
MALRPPRWAKRQSTASVDEPGSKGMLKTVYIILLVLWVAVVGIVLYLAYRRYKRARTQQRRPLGDDEPGTALATLGTKRVLTEDEVAELRVVTLTDDDIQWSRLLATAAHRTSAPAPVHVRTSRDAARPAATTLPRVLRPMRRIETSLALPAPARPPRRARSLPNGCISAPLPPQKTSDAARKRQTISPLHEENCAVCLDDYAVGDQVRQLPCRHYYHTTCIDPWLMSNSAVCPLCNCNVGATFDAPKRGSADEAR